MSTVRTILAIRRKVYDLDEKHFSVVAIAAVVCGVGLAWFTAPAPVPPRIPNAFEVERKAVEGVPVDAELFTEEVKAWKGPAAAPHTPVMSVGDGVWRRYTPSPAGEKTGLYLGDLRVLVSRPLVEEPE